MEEMVISAGSSSAGCYVVKGPSGASTGNANTAAGGEETAGGGKCGRWNPTAEQVKVLTELFRAGLRTPSTEQIQRISSHLGAFGKIESKNVFYWFQNHKARERLHHKKRRRDTAPPVAMGHYHRPAAGAGDLLFTARPPEQSTRSTKRPADAAVSRLTINMPFSEQLPGGVGDQIRRRETLELFPLSSYEAPVIMAERIDQPLLFSLGIGGVDDQLPPLDLRLSSP